MVRRLDIQKSYLFFRLGRTKLIRNHGELQQRLDLLRGIWMELQLDIDEALMASVKRLTEIDDPQQAILDAVKRYVRLEAGRRLSAMGGSDPTAEAAPRRRFS